MASSFVIAKRYSKALLESLTSRDSASLNQLSSQFSGFAATIRNSSELGNLLKNPEFSSDEKFKVLLALSQSMKMSENFEKFLKVVTFANRADLLVEIEAQFKELVLNLDAAVEAHVETAVPLSAAHSAEISALITKLIGKKVKLIEAVNPNLVAGVKVSVMGKTLDSTLPTSLDLVHRELIQAEA